VTFSHYETYENYHATFYQHVEAQSVTPFSPRALDRGLTGAMLSIMRHSYDPFSANDGAGAMTSPSRNEMLKTIGAISARTWEVTEDSAKKGLTEDEMKSRADDWANEAGVGKLYLFHHDPEHDDDEMDRIAAAAAKARPGTVVAREGLSIEI